MNAKKTKQKYRQYVDKMFQNSSQKGKIKFLTHHEIWKKMNAKKQNKNIGNMLAKCSTIRHRKEKKPYAPWNMKKMDASKSK